MHRLGGGVGRVSPHAKQGWARPCAHAWPGGGGGRVRPHAWPGDVTARTKLAGWRGWAHPPAHIRRACVPGGRTWFEQRRVRRICFPGRVHIRHAERQQTSGSAAACKQPQVVLSGLHITCRKLGYSENSGSVQYQCAVLCCLAAEFLSLRRGRFPHLSQQVSGTETAVWGGWGSYHQCHCQAVHACLNTP